ncbi:MAG: nickel-dependent lactate racemase [Anaerolineales bacterium]|nr:nickel-dependent lactate racemase [Anaerolineales bacterium]
MSLLPVRLPYGTHQITFGVPASNVLGIVHPNVNTAGRDEDHLVRKALADPISSPRLCNLAYNRQSAAIVISDITRPCPTQRLLPHILDELKSAGINERDILIIVALGTHRRMKEAEIASMVGPTIINRIRVINHDPEDTVRLGISSAGTPVEIFRPLTEVDLRICIGNIEYHYFAGFSGGSKAIVPGCASKATITANHAKMFHPNATAGMIDSNPVRADIEEGAAFMGSDFILNVILDHDHRIIDAVAGNAIEAHRKGCEIVKEQRAVLIPKKAEIVLASAGGYPEDINLYQAHKGLENARYFVQKGGQIIFVAECKEGFGSSVFEEWITQGAAPGELISRIQQEFVLGGHKAAALASILRKTTVHLVSDLCPEMVRCCGMVPVGNIQETLKSVFEVMGNSADVLVLPKASSVHPMISD